MAFYFFFTSCGISVVVHWLFPPPYYLIKSWLNFWLSQDFRKSQIDLKLEAKSEFLGSNLSLNQMF